MKKRMIEVVYELGPWRFHQSDGGERSRLWLGCGESADRGVRRLWLVGGEAVDRAVEVRESGGVFSWGIYVPPFDVPCHVQSGEAPDLLAAIAEADDALDTWIDSHCHSRHWG